MPGVAVAAAATGAALVVAGLALTIVALSRTRDRHR